MSEDENSGNDDNTTGLADVLDKLLSNIDGDQASVHDVVAAFQDRGFGALIAVVGTIAAAPIIGAIPGMSVLIGLLVLLVAGQYIFGRTSPWIPSFLAQRSMDKSTLEKGIKKARPYASWLDQYVKPRLTWLIEGPVQRRLIAFVVCILAITMVPLALIPWGVQAPATAIVLFGVALIGRDGAFAAAGYALVAITAYVLNRYWDSLVQSIAALVGS